MLDLLARGRIAPAGVSDSARAREQDLRHRISELTRMVVSGPGASGLRGPGISAASLDAARDALDSAQRAYADLLLEIREESPEYARLVSGETVGWRDVAARLAPDEALIEYLIADSTSLAFVVTDRGVNSVDLHVTRHTLATLVEFARVNLARPDDAAARALWPAPLRRLYRYLVEPVEAAGYLSGTRALIVAPHGELHYLPFAALLVPGAAGAREQFLVERYAVTYTPSASLWLRLGERRGAVAGGRVLALAPRVGALPASREEVEAIRRIYGARATVLTGAAASERAFRAAAPQSDIIHLATYGVLNKRNPLFSFVELTPADSADGRLEVHDVFGLSLSARLVVLSACQTGLGSGALGDVPAGDDWVGLAQAFLIAGASNVIATLWPVEDRVTARLMERFYTELRAGRSEAEALAETQRAARRGGTTAHPFYWAGLALFGRRGGCPAGGCAP
jgi:CHAT domain-containing protein